MTISNFVVKKYPLDLTATLASNIITNEEHDLDSTNFPFIVPQVGSFFDRDITLSLTDTETNTSKKLKFGLEYNFDYLNIDASKLAGKAVYDAIVFTKGVKGKLSITYHVIGDPFIDRRTEVLNAYNEWLTDARPVDWENITNRPLEFPSIDHMHSVWDFKDWGGFTTAIRDEVELLKAMLYGVFENKIQLVYIRTRLTAMNIRLDDFKSTLDDYKVEVDTKVANLTTLVNNLKTLVDKFQPLENYGIGFTASSIDKTAYKNLQFKITTLSDWNKIRELKTGTFCQITASVGMVSLNTFSEKMVTNTSGITSTIDTSLKQSTNTEQLVLTGMTLYQSGTDNKLFVSTGNEAYELTVTANGATLNKRFMFTDKIAFINGMIDSKTGIGYHFNQDEVSEGLSDGLANCNYYDDTSRTAFLSNLNAVNAIYKRPIGSFVTLTGTLAANIDGRWGIPFSLNRVKGHLVYKTQTDLVLNVVCKERPNGFMIHIAYQATETSITSIKGLYFKGVAPTTEGNYEINGDWVFLNGFKDDVTGIGYTTHDNVVRIYEGGESDAVQVNQILNQKINTTYVIKRDRLVSGSFISKFIPGEAAIKTAYHLTKLSGTSEASNYILTQFSDIVNVWTGTATTPSNSTIVTFTWLNVLTKSKLMVTIDTNTNTITRGEEEVPKSGGIPNRVVWQFKTFDKTVDSNFPLLTATKDSNNTANSVITARVTISKHDGGANGYNGIDQEYRYIISDTANSTLLLKIYKVQYGDTCIAKTDIIGKITDDVKTIYLANIPPMAAGNIEITYDPYWDVANTGELSPFIDSGTISLDLPKYVSFKTIPITNDLGFNSKTNPAPVAVKTASEFYASIKTLKRDESRAYTSSVNLAYLGYKFYIKALSKGGVYANEDSETMEGIFLGTRSDSGEDVYIAKTVGEHPPVWYNLITGNNLENNIINLYKRPVFRDGFTISKNTSDEATPSGLYLTSISSSLYYLGYGSTSQPGNDKGATTDKSNPLVSYQTNSRIINNYATVGFGTSVTTGIAGNIDVDRSTGYFRVNGVDYRVYSGGFRYSFSGVLTDSQMYLNTPDKKLPIGSYYFDLNQSSMGSAGQAYRVPVLQSGYITRVTSDIDGTIFNEFRPKYSTKSYYLTYDSTGKSSTWISDIHAPELRITSSDTEADQFKKFLNLPPQTRMFIDTSSVYEDVGIRKILPTFTPSDRSPKILSYQDTFDSARQVQVIDGKYVYYGVVTKTSDGWQGEWLHPLTTVLESVVYNSTTGASTRSTDDRYEPMLKSNASSFVMTDAISYYYGLGQSYLPDVLGGVLPCNRRTLTTVNIADNEGAVRLDLDGTSSNYSSVLSQLGISEGQVAYLNNVSTIYLTLRRGSRNDDYYTSSYIIKGSSFMLMPAKNGTDISYRFYGDFRTSPDSSNEIMITFNGGSSYTTSGTNFQNINNYLFADKGLYKIVLFPPSPAMIYGGSITQSMLAKTVTLDTSAGIFINDDMMYNSLIFGDNRNVELYVGVAQLKLNVSNNGVTVTEYSKQSGASALIQTTFTDGLLIHPDATYCISMNPSYVSLFTGNVSKDTRSPLMLLRNKGVANNITWQTIFDGGTSVTITIPYIYAINNGPFVPLESIVVPQKLAGKVSAGTYFNLPSSLKTSSYVKTTPSITSSTCTKSGSNYLFKFWISGFPKDADLTDNVLSSGIVRILSSSEDAGRYRSFLKGGFGGNDMGSVRIYGSVTVSLNVSIYQPTSSNYATSTREITTSNISNYKWGTYLGPIHILKPGSGGVWDGSMVVSVILNGSTITTKTTNNEPSTDGVNPLSLTMTLDDGIGDYTIPLTFPAIPS